LTKRRARLTAACLFLIFSAIAASAERAPRNVIVLIGDGMGFAQMTLARLSLGTPDAALAMDSMPVAAFVKTHSAGPGRGRGVITDSAAAATALSAGVKTNNGMIAVLPDGRPVRTILEAAGASGRATGLVTTVTISHATPAGFAAHVGSRGDEAEIASQLIKQRVDVLLGGGEAYFLPRSASGSKRKDDRDLLAEAKGSGYVVARSGQELKESRGCRVLGLFAAGALDPTRAGPSLAEMASAALERLTSGRKGFFLMVEGGQIDWASHANDAAGTVRETLEFDEAVRAALEFARKRGDTLVVVTADHETGGLAIVAPASGSSAEFAAAWGTKSHSATIVPLLAEGPGARLFGGVMDNTEVPRRIARLWRLRLDDPPPAAP